MRCAFLLAASLLLATPLAAATARGTQPLTHEALWLMKRVGAPAVSPDGRWAVFPVTEPSYDEKKEVQDLWIVPVDGSAHAAPAHRRPGRRELSRVEPRQPADRLHARSGTTTRWRRSTCSTSPAAARRSGVSSSPLAARAPRWSPDGRWIAYQSAVYEGATDVESNRKLAAARKEAKSKVRAYETFPIRRWDKWLDETATHVFAVAADGSGDGARPARGDEARRRARLRRRRRRGLRATTCGRSGRPTAARS